MKTILLFITVLCISISCKNPQKEGTSKETEKNLLVFINDKSQSVHVSGASIDKQTIWIKRFLHEHQTPNNDIWISTIGSYSANPANGHIIKFSDNSKPGENDGFESDEEKMLREVTERNNYQKVFKAGQKELLYHLFEKPEKISGQTAILELLPALAAKVRNYGGGTDIVVISDMIQESNYQNMTRGNFPFPDRKYAEEQATKDWEKLQKDLKCSSDDLASARSITILVPEAAEEAFLVNVDAYWDYLFKQMGFEGKAEWSKP